MPDLILACLDAASRVLSQREESDRVNLQNDSGNATFAAARPRPHHPPALAAEDFASRCRAADVRGGS